MTDDLIAKFSAALASARMSAISSHAPASVFSTLDLSSSKPSRMPSPQVEPSSLLDPIGLNLEQGLPAPQAQPLCRHQEPTDTGKDENERIRLVMLNSSQSPRATDYYLAVSGMETGFIWHHDAMGSIYVPGCQRTPIGLEERSGVRWSTWNHLDVRDYLVKTGKVGEAVSPSTGSIAMRWHPTISQAGPHSPVLRAFFEDTLRYRFAPLLRYWSIGPTQLRLLYTGPTMGGGNLGRGRPATWQAIYDWYFANRSELTFFIRGYLGEGPANDSDQSVITWLRQYQTGIRMADKDTDPDSLAREYYLGAGNYASRPGVKAYLAKVRSIRTAM